MKKPLSHPPLLTSNTAAEEALQHLRQQATAAPTSLAEAHALLAQSLAQQEALLLENQQLHAQQQELARRLAAVGEGQPRLAFATPPQQLPMTSADMVYKMSADWRHLYHVLGKNLGADTASSADSWLQTYIPEEEQPAVAAAIDRAIKAKSLFEHEHRVVRADGSVGWVHAWAVPVLDEQGEIVAWEGAASDVTSRKQAEQEVLRLQKELAQRADDKYRALFNAIDEGFCLIEIVYDAQGKATDCLVLEVNEVYEQLTGLANPQGRLTSELALGTETLWLEMHAEVVRTGQPIRFQNYHQPSGRWYESYVSRVGGAGSRQACIVFTEITERKRAEKDLQEREARKSYLLKLSDTLSPLASAVAIQEAVTHVARDYFQADRCYYGEIQDDECIIRRDASLGAHPSVAGVYKLSTMPLFQAAVEAGQPFVVEDAHTAELLDEPLRELCLQLQISSFIVIPVIKNGKPRGVFCVVQSTPRAWTPLQVELAQETAERIWAAVERAHAEDALRISEERLRTLIDNLPGGAAFIVGPDLRYQLAAGDALGATGCTAAEFVGRHVAEAVPPEELAYHEANYRQALAGQPFEHEHYINGRAFVSRGTPLRAATGEVSAVLVVSYDITDRHRTEVALQQSETRLRIALEAAELGTWDWDLASNAVYWNTRHFTQLGLEPQPMPCTPADFECYVHPDDRPAVMQKLRTAVAKLRVFQAEFRVITAQGALRWMSGYGQSTDVDAQGRCRRMSGVMLDITERKQAEQQLQELAASLERKVARRTQALRQSRDLLQSVYDTTLIGMAVVRAERDATGKIEDFTFVSVNRQLELVTGRPDLVGKRYAQEFPGIVPSGLLERMRQVVATGTPQQLEYFYPYEGDVQWYSSVYVKLGDGVVATTLNITERKQAEAERHRQFTLLQQAESMAELGSWEYDLATGSFHWSAGMYRLFGLPYGTRVQPGIYLDYALADDRAAAERLIRGITHTPSDFDETLRLRVGGEIKTVRIRAVLHRNPQAQPQRLLGVDLDLSEVRRLEADNLHLRLEQQRALFEAIQQAQEAERKRIAEGLHNGVGQLLYATKLRLDQLPTPLPSTEPAQALARQEADRLLADAISQTRALSHELVPMTLEQYGLAAALQDICQEMGSPRLRFHCTVELDENEPPLPPTMQLALYRMAQELAQNIVKHAKGATEAFLELETMPGAVVLRVQDDGPGFVGTAGNTPGLGLRSIRDRVAVLGGTIEQGSLVPSGAYVRLRLPLSTTSQGS